MQRIPFPRTYRLRSLVVLVFLSAIGIEAFKAQRGWAENAEISRYHKQMNRSKLAEAASLEAEVKADRAYWSERTRDGGIGACGFTSADMQFREQRVRLLKKEADMHLAEELNHKNRW